MCPGAHSSSASFFLGLGFILRPDRKDLSQAYAGDRTGGRAARRGDERILEEKDDPGTTNLVAAPLLVVLSPAARPGGVQMTTTQDVLVTAVPVHRLTIRGRVVDGIWHGSRPPACRPGRSPILQPYYDLFNSLQRVMNNSQAVFG